MLEPGCPSIIKPGLIIFWNSLEFGTFPDDWEKKGNVVTVYEKYNKLLINNTTLYPCYLYVS